MKWRVKQPAFSDVVRVDVGGFYHYGIFVSDEQIIQFGYPPRNAQMLFGKDVRVVSTDADTFLCGNIIEVGELSFTEKLKAYSKKKIVERAKQRLGEGGYDILTNNCEHFVNECVFGKKSSNQVEKMENDFKNRRYLNVYLARGCEFDDDISSFDQKRREQIENISSIQLKKQRTAVWKLLQIAVYNSLNKELEDIELTLSKNGKWLAKDCCISLSHTNNVVCVALSSVQVGVDLEKDRALKNGAEKLILSEEEKREFYGLSESEKNEFLLEKWTQKESVFKSLDQKNFLPTSTKTNFAKTQKIELDNEKYFLSVYSEENLKPMLYLYEDNNLRYFKS